MIRTNKPVKGSFHYKEDIHPLAKLCYEAARRQAIAKMTTCERIKYHTVKAATKMALWRNK